MSDKTPSILKDYVFIKEIGEGNFGKVKLSKLISTNEKYAIKILNKDKLKAQTKTSKINEIEILSKLKHPNIIHVEKILEDKDNYYIIMEYCSEGELFDYIVNQEKLSEIEASIFFYQLIKGVEYIHKQGLAHRDLKPENLLLTKDHIIKIIDFGLCHDFDGSKMLKTKCGSPSYAAPEILKGFPYDGFKSDIWCCGIILYGMLCGYLPFDGDNNQEIFREIVKCNPEYPPFLEDDSVDLISRILNSEPDDRITISQIKKHAFYLKGKYYYYLKYDENEEIKDELGINNRSNSLKITKSIKGNKSEEKKKIVYSTVKKQKDNAIMFNNIKTMTKKNINKKFENNIYKNIFTTIGYKEEINNRKKNKIFLLNDNEKNELKSDKNQIRNPAETEENAKKESLFLTTFKNKFKENRLKLISNKQFFNNKKNNTNNTNQSNSYIKNNHLNKKNKILIDLYSLNSIKNEKRPFNNMNFILNNQKKRIISKNNKNNSKERQNKKEDLDYLQNFLSNKTKNNKNEIAIQSPEKHNEINFNLLLTKTNENNKNKNNNKFFSEKKEKNNSLSAQKIKKSSSQKKKLILNFINSPSSDIKKSNNIKNKFNSLFNKRTNNKDGIKSIETDFINKLERENLSYSIKKTNRKNNKLNINKNINLFNINNKGNSVKKKGKNFFIKTNPNYRTEAIREIILKKNTESKCNQFLEKVIKKMYTKEKPIINNNINIITFNNNFGNKNNNQVFKMFEIDNGDKNNLNSNEFLENLHLINNKNISYNDGNNKKSNKFHIYLKDDKKRNYKNQKYINTGRFAQKEKFEKYFPNLITHNK